MYPWVFLNNSRFVWHSECCFNFLITTVRYNIPNTDNNFIQQVNHKIYFRSIFFDFLLYWKSKRFFLLLFWFWSLLSVNHFIITWRERFPFISWYSSWFVFFYVFARISPILNFSFLLWFLPNRVYIFRILLKSIKIATGGSKGTQYHKFDSVFQVLRQASLSSMKFWWLILSTFVLREEQNNFDVKHRFSFENIKIRMIDESGTHHREMLIEWRSCFVRKYTNWGIWNELAL